MDILSLVTFLPLFAAVVVALMPARAVGAIKGFALAASIAVFVVSLKLVQGFVANPDMQFVVDAPWLPSLGIAYHIGIDGISLFLVMLVTFLTPITILGCLNSISDRVKEFFVCVLFLETAMIGAFISMDMFLFYIFWEAMLIPMYFMIGMWGGERKIYATVKFFIYTMVGSLLMLIAILYLVHQSKVQTGSLSFDLGVLLSTSLSAQQQWLLFLAFALAFAIKVPMFPFHTWLPDAHVEAPTPGSVILAGVLLKMGTYGFIRFAMPLFPEAAIRAIPLIATLAIIGIIYGALVAMVQKDVKKLVAYSSVSHLGFVMLGLVALNTHAVEGAILGMINHGISTGALFLLVGVIYERRHTRLISEYGGLTRVMPVYATVFMVVTLSSIGLPPLNGFVHEFLILVGAFQANAWWGILAATGVVLGAIYMLWMYQRMFFGEVTNEKNSGLKDLSLREIAVFIPLIAMIFWMGVYSKPFVSRMEPAVNQFVEQMTSYRAAMNAREGAVVDEAMLSGKPAVDVKVGEN
ncbi:MAG TPA: NADH-quinone oxidoreductase subunit M [Candidatus Krumholzibacteria bacterium]|nr:NADH-quinone oxidoreductase subunit M [Candidatus Krumholzibacteria bacterium]